ncbi:hypothetical protein H3V53_13860 [Paraburkholderia bengalensis]|uniref:GNAT family N-acetyltransferase n=1 Tax=Paraburkholderia bengalensis TaxID=2747562 RepID=A0ABU8IS27_9BURK
MSAHAYVNLEDVPLRLRETSAQRVGDESGVTLVAFDGCPFVGHCELGASQIEYPFPRAPELRGALVEWLLHWSINFYVIAG